MVYGMSMKLRLVLIIVSLLSVTFVLNKIKRAVVKSSEAIYWFLFSGLIILLSLFPKIAIYFSGVLHIESTVNFVFLIFIFLLIIKNFLLSIKCSQLETKLTMLIQYVVLENKENEIT